MFDYEIVIPVLNQRRYTEQCLQSLVANGVAPAQILIVDNGSTDDTPAWLSQHPEFRSIRNPLNLGCGGGWTQGAFATQAPWVFFLNNDIVVGPNTLTAMIEAAERFKLDIVSCALIEGPLDYDFPAFHAQYVAKMKDVLRRDFGHGVCFGMRRALFSKIGFFDTDPALGGAADAEFEMRCKQAGGQVGVTGAALVHHFGSITVSELKREQGVRDLGDRHRYYRKMGLNWLGRRLFRRTKQQALRQARDAELAQFGMTLHMDRVASDAGNAQASDRQPWVYR